MFSFQTKSATQSRQGIKLRKWCRASGSTYFSGPARNLPSESHTSFRSSPSSFLQATTSACPPLLGSYRHRDEMKPSISVIAAARRFLAIPLRSSHISSGKRSDPTSIPDGSSFLLGHPLPLPPSLSLSSFLMRDVDSLLGSNFYRDASSNISGLRLLALVFDERTSWSILSDGWEISLPSSFPYRSTPSHSSNFATTCFYIFSTVSSDFCPSIDTVQLHLQRVSLENHSNTISGSG